MQVETFGIILNTEHYADCVGFYRDALGLKVMFEKATAEERLTCFDMGGAYLMVEPGGRASAAGKPPGECPSKLRFNVADVEAAVAELASRGVQAEVRRRPWGVTAEFLDPDGNRCALRGVAGFGE
ncbi:VOC family protein [Roseovarius sp.]|uniref:VOC family protein n=1 Tax=Roseovarius sp. TaxID=1486281 RepID=UPI003BAB1D8D